MEERRHIRQPRQRQQPLGVEEAHHLAEVRLRVFTVLERPQRAPAQDRSFAGIALGLHGHERQDAVEFESVERIRGRHRSCTCVPKRPLFRHFFFAASATAGSTKFL
jgi:hypothetical protein